MDSSKQKNTNNMIEDLQSKCEEKDLEMLNLKEQAQRLENEKREKENENYEMIDGDGSLNGKW